MLLLSANMETCNTSLDKDLVGKVKSSVWAIVLL